MHLRTHARLARSALLASLFGALALAANAPAAIAADTETTLSATPAPVWGEAVTITATVKDTADPGVHPTGTVTFTLEGVETPVTVVDGTASISRSTLEVTSHTVRAAFAGTGGFNNSVAQELVVTVDKADVNVSETVTPDPTMAGQNATFTATVTARAPGAGEPTGPVAFFDDDGSPILDPVSLSGGKASISVPAPAGRYRVHAVYFGDGHFNDNDLTAVDQTVDKAGTTTTLSSSAAQVPPGQPVVLTAMVSVTPPGDAPTFGTMQFTLNGVPLSTPFALEGATVLRANWRVPQVPGQYVIGVAYSGDDNTKPSTASLPITVGAAGGGGGGGGATVDKKSLSAVGSTLMKALRKRGLAALRGTREPFTAPTAGVLDQAVDSPKPLKSAKAVRLASGRTVFSGPGSGVLKLRLTAAGKRAIRQGKTLRVAIVTTFTTVQGTPVSVVQRLKVKVKKGAKAAALETGWSLSGVTRIGPKTAQLNGRS